MPTLLFHDEPGHTRIRRFGRAAAEAGAVFHPLLNWFISGARTPDAIDAAIQAANEASQRWSTDQGAAPTARRQRTVTRHHRRAACSAVASFGVAEIAQPMGTVTFLFSDIEGSTPLWDRYPAEMQEAAARHDQILRDVISDSGGYIFTTAGDEFAAAFSRASQAVTAAAAIQAALDAESFPSTTPLCVRMGMHTGDAVERDGDYFGPAVIRAARLMGIAQGGQILMSGPTADIIRGGLPDELHIEFRGDVQLKGLGRAERVHELRHPACTDAFPDLAGATHGHGRGRLPRITDELVGRAADVERVAALVDTAPLVTLAGPGGVGKTRLSIEVGDQLVDRYPDGAWFIELASVSSGDSVDQAVAEVLGVQEVSGRTLTDSIVSALSGRRILLIVDNCEHVLDAARDLIAALLAGCDGVAVLASSREALAVRGERVCPIDPLRLPAEGQPVADAAAVQLFVERWLASDPAAVVDDDALHAVASICDQLDGMPLAIELAAARARGLGVDRLVERLDGALRLLRSRSGEDRHRTLQAVVAWSFDRLEPHLQDLLCRAGVFAGGFTLESAEAVLAFGGLDELDVDDGIAELVDKSMIQVHDGPGGKRHRLLETMRQFGAEHIDEGDRAAVERRFVEHAADLAASVEAGIVGPAPRSSFERGVVEFDNLREACRLAMSQGWLDATAAILLPLGELGTRMVIGEVFVLMDQLADLLPRGHPLELSVMSTATFNAHTRGETARARRYVERFESVEASAPDTIGSDVHKGIGVAYWMRGDTARAIEQQRRAIEGFEAERRMDQVAFTLSTLSMALDAVDRPEALRSARRAVAVAESIEAPAMLCNALLSLAGVQTHSDHSAARSSADRLVSVANEIGALWFRATGTRVQAHIASRAGELAEASELFAAALDLNGVGDFGELLWYTVLNAVEHLGRAGLYVDAAVALGAFTSASGASRDQLVVRAVDRMKGHLRSELSDGEFDEAFTRGAGLATGELLIHLDAVLRSHALAAS